jgi:hypothetical protein
VRGSSEESGEGYWEQVQEIGQIKLGQATTVRFQRGITKRDKREVIAIRAWVEGARYKGPTRQGFNLDVKTAGEFYGLLGKALGKA